MMRSNELIGGVALIALGAFVALYALHSLPIGTARSMGPGYFPLILGILLALFGIIISLTGLRAGEGARRPISLRAIIMVSLAPLVFGFTVRGLGFGPAVLLTGVVAALACRGGTVTRVLVVPVSIAAFTILTFSVGLNLSFPLIGPWLEFR